MHLFKVNCHDDKTHIEMLLIDNDDVPVLKYSPEIDNVDSVVYFNRHFVKLAILKRFDIYLLKDQ